MFMCYSALTRCAFGGRVHLFAAFEPTGAYLGTFTLDDLHCFAQGQSFWVNAVKYYPAGQAVDVRALGWRPNGLLRGDTVWSFTGFRVSPVREMSDTGQVEVCAPGEHQFWSIYGYHREAEEWRIVHDADGGDIGECLARIADLTGERIEYRDTGHAYANTRLADLPEMLSQRILDEIPHDGDPAQRADDADAHPLTELREQILAALTRREM